MPNYRDRIIRSVNWHITTKCNYKCKFCFVKILDNEITDCSKALSVLNKLKDTKTEFIDIEKINFVGGEPFLHPLFYELLRMAHDLGFTTSIVTNGSFINDRNIIDIEKYTDWIGISLDSISNLKEAEIGRGRGNHVSHAIEVSDLVHEHGMKLKVNTTVTKQTYHENMHNLIHRMNPNRWKAFQMLHIKGQNDNCVKEFAVTDNEFKDFVNRHRDIRLIGGAKPVFESTNDMKGSYMILSPSAKVISNSSGSYQTFELDDFLKKPDSIVNISKYMKRGGIYEWTK